MNAIRQLLKRVMSACLPRERFLVSGPRSKGPKPQLALTFDDGPHPEHTARLLDRLDQLGLRATFFVVGRNAEKYPQLIQRIADAGHELANHTYTHSEPRQTSARQFIDEIQQTDRLIEQLVGCSMSSMRPPKGELSLAKWRGLWRTRKTVALWNVDPRDYRMQSVDDVTRWCEGYRPQDGDIVLMHDIHPYAAHAIDAMAARGDFQRFDTVTICDWLKPQGGRVDQSIAVGGPKK